MAKTPVPKIKDVARVAGVSTATVSRALSRPEAVAEATRNAVLDAARETGYRINLAARNLRRQQTGAIVVLVPNLGNPFFSEILAGIEAKLTAAGLSVLVVDTGQAKARNDLLYSYLHNSRADGILCLDGSLPDHILKASRMPGMQPPIVFACEWYATSGYPSVRIDNVSGARMAIRHLAGLGHRRIGYVRGPGANVLTEARERGMLLEMESLGLDVREDWFFQGDFTVDSGAAAARQWLEMGDRPTALFCASDMMAFGFISELHHRGVYVPRDVSVVGFDDIDIARRFVPSLTTIRQPRSELGEKAADLLLRLIGGGDAAPVEAEVLPVELVERESTAHKPV